MQSQITEWGTALMTSLATAMALLFSSIPKLLGFALIVIVGWIIASLLGKAIVVLLRRVKFNELAQRSGFSDFVNKMGTELDSIGLIGAIVKWFVRLVALVVAFDALGLPAVSAVLSQLLLWLPNVIVAVVVLVIAGLAANALSKLVRATAAEAELENAVFLGRIASALIWGFGVVVAVNQIGIATTLVNTLFMAVVGAMALALGLAFGLGGRETAAQIVRHWYAKGRKNVSMLGEGELDQAANSMIDDGLGSFNERRAMQRRSS